MMLDVEGGVEDPAYVSPEQLNASAGIAHEESTSICNLPALRQQSASGLWHTRQATLLKASRAVGDSNFLKRPALEQLPGYLTVPHNRLRLGSLPVQT